MQVSSMWGFPAPCPKQHCSCDCWDARDARCHCAIPHNMAALFPAHFLIDYVRVYQVRFATTCSGLWRTHKDIEQFATLGSGSWHTHKNIEQ
jgi:hypothetical protein